jgi:hypothetical protein
MPAAAVSAEVKRLSAINPMAASADTSGGSKVMVKDSISNLQ